VPCGTVDSVDGHVFIGYSRRADRVYVEAWRSTWPRWACGSGSTARLSAGANWEWMIRTQIDACEAFVVVTSPEARGVRLELDRDFCEELCAPLIERTGGKLLNPTVARWPRS
jgi:hypothetical protein